MPKYLIVGREFRFDDNDFVGPVVASPHALYFVIQQYGLASGRGIVGGLIARINRLLGPAAARRRRCIDLSELPREVTEDPEWPVREKTGTVLAIPKAEIASLQMPRFWLDNRVYVEAGRVRVSAVYNLLVRGWLERLLMEMGWIRPE